jgi:hypothetical protein
MKRFFKYLFGILIVGLVSTSCFSQNDAPIQFGVDLMNRYIWRGVDLGGESPSIQPSLKHVWNSEDSNHSLVLGAWGAYNFATSNQEADLYFSYTYKNLVSFTLTDYYFPGLYSNDSNKGKYFNYKKDATGHVFEPAINFNGTEKFPFTFLFAINVYGADAAKVNDDGTSGDIFKSKYIEIGYKKSIKGVDFNAFLGGVLDDPKEETGELGYYGLNKSAGIVNLGVKVAKKIKITDTFEIPVQASLVANPEAEKLYIVFGISF